MEFSKDAVLKLKCKNDPKRYYKGTEPSPKGLGYCGYVCVTSDGAYDYIVGYDKKTKKVVQFIVFFLP
jgi:hypothetical protein